MIVTAKRLIEDPRDIRPHVVLLGAGASKAAFPKGDACGKTLPLMDDLVSVIELQPLIDKAGPQIGREQNFEAIYSRMAECPEYDDILKQVEERIYIYFSALSLPKTATIYDRLILSLRSTDAVFTFNWDPFLFDAYQRNFGVVPLPEIFFLHGNVRIGVCRNHNRWGRRNGQCPVCGQGFTDVPLLYPIAHKNYSKDIYIRGNWEAAEMLFKAAFTMTIFGYGAPHSDKDAIELLRAAWISRSNRQFEHVELIDTADEYLLHERVIAHPPC